jgi:hypothetical protein
MSCNVDVLDVPARPTVEKFPATANEAYLLAVLVQLLMREA